jgi:hypothetical protein
MVIVLLKADISYKIVKIGIINKYNESKQHIFRIDAMKYTFMKLPCIG